jgi:hypothetical protein
MSDPTSPTPRRARRPLALAGAVLAAAATFGGLGARQADASAGHAALPPGGPGACFKEYDFTRGGNTLIASAFRDCTNVDEPIPLPVGIQMWYVDLGFAGWVTIASGSGVVQNSWCNPSWPTWYRHSVTHEQIFCP